MIPIVGDEESSEPSAEETLGAASRARLALAELPHEQREAIVLYEIEDWKVEEIAELLDISVSAIKSRLARGRDRLRTIYARRFGVALGPVPSMIPGETR